MSIMANPTPKVELRGVKKRFGSKVVLDGVDLKIERGRSPCCDWRFWNRQSSVMIKCVLGIFAPRRRPDLRRRAGSDQTERPCPRRISASIRDAVSGRRPFRFCSPFGKTSPSELIQGRGVSRKKARDTALEKARQGRPRSRRRHALAGRIVGRNAKACWSGARHRRRSSDHLLRRTHDGPRPDHGRRHQRPDCDDGETSGCHHLVDHPRHGGVRTRFPIASRCCTKARSSGKARQSRLITAAIPTSINSSTVAPRGRSRWRSGPELGNPTPPHSSCP